MHICPRCRRTLRALSIGVSICIYCAPLLIGEHDAVPDHLQMVLPGSHDDEPAQMQEEAPAIKTVATVSGAGATTPFGWNMTTLELPPASRARNFAAIMMPFTDNGWLVRFGDGGKDGSEGT